MALWKRKPEAGLLWHSDRGSQYASDSHRQLLKHFGIRQSMSRRGDCWGGSAPWVQRRVRKLFSFMPCGYTLKTELLHHRCYQARAEAKQEIFEYIEVFYLCPVGITGSACILPIIIGRQWITKCSLNQLNRVSKFLLTHQGQPPSTNRSITARTVG